MSHSGNDVGILLAALMPMLPMLLLLLLLGGARDREASGAALSALPAAADCVCNAVRQKQKRDAPTLTWLAT